MLKSRYFSLFTFLLVAMLLCLTLQDKPDFDDDFDNYQKKNNKRYSNNEEKTYRTSVFKKNVKRMRDHNSNPSRAYDEGPNQFTDLTNDEFVSSVLMSSSVLTQELQVASAAGNTTDARTAAIANGDIVVGAVTPVDWTLKMTAVKDQKSCGSCWAFTAVGLIEAGLRIKYGSVYNFAEQELVDCCLSTLTSVCYVGSGCQGGNSEQALNYVSKWGIAATSAYPYAARLGSCRNSSTSRYKVVNSAAPVSYVARLSASSLQNSIAKKPTAIYVDASSWQWYFSGIFTGCIYTGLNHAVIAVGYDASGNWKIRNSWGPLWGEAGHIRIAAVGNPCGVLSFPFTTTVV